MATRYSGTLKINVLYNDRQDAYRASISRKGKSLWSGWIGRAPASRLAVDSPEAYDAAARAALAFADDDGADVSDYADFTDSGYNVRRTEKHPSRTNGAKGGIVSSRQLSGYKSALSEPLGLSFNDSYNIDRYGITREQYDAIDRCVGRMVGYLGRKERVTLQQLNSYLSGDGFFPAMADSETRERVASAFRKTASRTNGAKKPLSAFAKAYYDLWWKSADMGETDDVEMSREAYHRGELTDADLAEAKFTVAKVTGDRERRRTVRGTTFVGRAVKVSVYPYPYPGSGLRTYEIITSPNYGIDEGSGTTDVWSLPEPEPVQRAIFEAVSNLRGRGRGRRDPVVAK